MSLSAQLFRAGFLALAEEKDDIELEEDDPLVEALTNFSDECDSSKFQNFVLFPKHDTMPQTVYGVVDIIAQTKNDDLGSKTLVAAAEQLSPPIDRLGSAKKTVALKITVVPARSKLSGTFLDAMRDVAGEFKNAAKITKKHGVSNMFVNAHSGAFPALFFYNGQIQSAFAWSMDFCKGGTLNDFNDWLIEQTWLTEDQRISVLLPIIYGLIVALKQLHALHLGHRDLHEGNVLFDHEGTLNIGDFGRAKKKVMNPKIDLNQTVYGDANNPPPESTHPHPVESVPRRGNQPVSFLSSDKKQKKFKERLDTFTDEAYYDPLGVDLWSVGTLISDMLCPADKQLKWPSDEQIANTKRPKLIHLCVESRKNQVKKNWSPAMKKILDGRLFDWTLNSFKVETKSVTITDADIKFLFKNQKIDDTIFKAVWKYYYDVKRREKDPFLSDEDREEAVRVRKETEPNIPQLSNMKSKSPLAKSTQSVLKSVAVVPPPAPKVGRLPPKKRYLDEDEEPSKLPPNKRQRANPN